MSVRVIAIAAAISAFVAAPLARAETPTSEAAPAPSPPSSGGAEVFASLDEGFGVRSSDGAHALRLGGLLAPRIGLREGNDDPAFAAIHLARLNLTGRLADDLVRFQLQAELAGEPKLLDAELDVRPWPELSFRIGQFRTPFSRHFMTGLPMVALTERSFVSDVFRADRDIGVAIDARPFEGMLEVHAGIFDGSGTARPFEDARPMLVGRVVAAPLGAFPYDETVLRGDAPARMALGFGAYANERSARREATDETGAVVSELSPAMRREAFGVEAAFRWRRLALFAEAYLSREGEVGAAPHEMVGGFAQATVGVVEGVIDATARFDLLSPDPEGASLRGLRRYEAGLNWYALGPTLRLQARYAYGEVDEGVTAPKRAPPPGHEGILQLMLAF